VKHLAAHQGSKDEQNYHLLLNTAWKSQLVVKGIAGLPSPDKASNIIGRQLTVNCGLRLPPTLKWQDAEKVLKDVLLKPSPDTFGAQVSFEVIGPGSGLDTPALPEAVQRKFDQACEAVFGEKAIFLGSGGSIPFMEVFQGHFPEARFLLTGVATARSNIHAANESLDLDFNEKFVEVLCRMLANDA